MMNETFLEPDQGVIIRKNKGQYEIYTQAGTFTATLTTRLWKELAEQYNTRPAARAHHTRGQPPAALEYDPLAVGDVVRFEKASDGPMRIAAVLPRQNHIARRAVMPGAHTVEQVIVANISQVVAVMAAAAPEPKWNLLDRYLVTAEAFGLPALVCITKLDLVTQPDGTLPAATAERLADYQRIGYPVRAVSAVNGAGLDAMRAALQGKTSVLLGKSGVGKSSLLNALEAGLGVRVSAVNQVTGKGRHTTTHLQMFPLAMGGAIVDTPGTREFGLWDIPPDELAQAFPEMRPYLGKCRFGLDCRHNEEPGCAVRKAVASGAVSPQRYRSLMILQEENDE